jgi:glutamate decarboxylase
MRDVVELSPLFTRPGESTEVPRSTLPEHELAPETAYQLVHDETLLDGNARLNLATFVGTWMDEYARRLYVETADKNIIDKDEYPATAAAERRCARIIADLWHAPDPDATIGVSTVGSSEACMLAGLALKRRWRSRQLAAGRPAERPNLVMSSAVQVCWEKFCNYFEVEPRYVPISDEHPVLDGHELESYVDENTIGVVAIMGVTYTGRYEPVSDIAGALDAIQLRSGLDVPIHVDAASGGFVAPFLQPHLAWDFRLPRVASINASGHKYGLVYPGLGWVVWRDQAALPDELIFRVSYLGGEVPTVTLNFSRPGAQVLLQHYLFLRLGYDGYRRVQQASSDVARVIAEAVASIDAFALWSDGSDIPVVTWRRHPDHTGLWNLHHLSDRLRTRGWLVPAYPLPTDLTDITVQRVVVRNGFSHDLARAFVDDLRAEVDYLNSLTTPMPDSPADTAFHH